MQQRFFQRCDVRCQLLSVNKTRALNAALAAANNFSLTEDGRTEGGNTSGPAWGKKPIPSSLSKLEPANLSARLTKAYRPPAE